MDKKTFARLRSERYFPPDWTDDMIQNAIFLVLQEQPKSVLDRIPMGGREKLSATVLGTTVEVALSRGKSGLKVITAHPLK